MQSESSSDWGEIDAMKTVAEALVNLDNEAIHRVLKWTNDRFGFAAPAQAAARSMTQVAQTRAPLDQTTPRESMNESTATDLAEFFTQAGPVTQSEKALVVGYWFQVVQGATDLDSQQINTELKNLGHGVSNITRAFDELIRTRPQVVIQTRKSGTAKQARKKYRLTAEGIARVKQMLGRDAGESSTLEDNK
jgi:hypothetical protein